MKNSNNNLSNEIVLIFLLPRFLVYFYSSSHINSSIHVCAYTNDIYTDVHMLDGLCMVCIR